MIIWFVACIAIAGWAYRWHQQRWPATPNPLTDITQRITWQWADTPSHMFDDIYTQWHTDLTDVLQKTADIMGSPYTSSVTMDITADYDASNASDDTLKRSLTTMAGDVKTASIQLVGSGDSMIDKNFYTQSDNSLSLNGSRSVDDTKDTTDASYDFNTITTTGDIMYVKLNDLAFTPPKALAQYRMQIMGGLGMIKGSVANQWIELPIDQIMQSTGNTDTTSVLFGKEMITVQRDMYQYIATLAKKHDTPLLKATRVDSTSDTPTGATVYHLTVNTDATMKLLDEIMDDTESPLWKYFTIVTTGMNDAPTPPDLRASYKKNKNDIQTVLDALFNPDEESMNPLILTITKQGDYTISTTQSDGDEYSFSRSHTVTKNKRDTTSNGTLTRTSSTDTTPTAQNIPNTDSNGSGDADTIATPIESTAETTTGDTAPVPSASTPSTPHTVVIAYTDTHTPSKTNAYTNKGDITVSIYDGIGTGSDATLRRKPSTLGYTSTFAPTNNNNNNTTRLSFVATDPIGITARGSIDTDTAPTKQSIEIPTTFVTFDEMFGQFLNTAWSSPSSESSSTETPMIETTSPAQPVQSSSWTTSWASGSPTE